MEMTFTDGVTKYGERDKYSQDEYIVQFNKYIRMPNFDRLYKSISNPEFVSNLDEFVAKRINEIKSMRISDEEKERQIEELKKINLYPLSRFKSIFDKFETFHEFYSFFNNHNLWEVSDKIFRFPNLKDKVLGQLNDIGLNKEQIDTMCRFMNLIKNRFDGDPGVMGFHIYPQLLQIMDTGMDREKGEMKFYLNAGIDTYREQIPALIDRHPEILYKLKEKIKQRAKEMGLDPEKICVAPEIVNTTGKMDFSKDQIDGLFRMLNAVGILTVGNPQYFMDFCTSPEIKKLLGQMQQSQEIQNMIKYAEIAKEQGEQGRANLRGATPAERDCILAKVAFKRWQEKGYSDKEIFNIITDSYHINGGYANEENLALAKIYYRRRGIPIQACRRESNGMYKLYIADNSPKGDEVRY